ncbi:MAG: DUF1638 domain-containing protein [Syntrophobacterales bacterium]
MRPATRLVACGVFRPALEHLRVEERYPRLRSTYLPSNLHLRPQDLRSRLSETITSAKQRNERIFCLYGECFPDIDDFCRQHGVIKVPGLHCFEMLLGSEQYENIINEMPGTYFLERDLILNFEEYCLEPLELYDEEMRKSFFEHYERILYLRQPSDPDLLSKANKLATFLQLSLEIRDADYSHLKKNLNDLF